MQFVTIKTKKDQDIRNVTLSYNDGQTTLLGSLEHGTEIIIDQDLINDLQMLVDENKERSLIKERGLYIATVLFEVDIGQEKHVGKTLRFVPWGTSFESSEWFLCLDIEDHLFLRSQLEFENQ